jgi:hypothetical protein
VHLAILETRATPEASLSQPNRRVDQLGWRSEEVM